VWAVFVFAFVTGAFFGFASGIGVALWCGIGLDHSECNPNSLCDKSSSVDQVSQDELIERGVAHLRRSLAEDDQNCSGVL
jgi:hypothetical protein